MSISGSARSVSGREECEAYVWGSNNSHQLAEGSQEKILGPKLTSSFTYVQQVTPQDSLVFPVIYDFDMIITLRIVRGGRKVVCTVSLNLDTACFVFLIYIWIL